MQTSCSLTAPDKTELDYRFHTYANLEWLTILCKIRDQIRDLSSMLRSGGKLQFQNLINYIYYDIGLIIKVDCLFSIISLVCILKYVHIAFYYRVKYSYIISICYGSLFFSL